MQLERLRKKRVREVSGSGNKEFCFGWSCFNWRRGDIRSSFGDTKRKCQEMSAQVDLLLEVWSFGER